MNSFRKNSKPNIFNGWVRLLIYAILFVPSVTGSLYLSNAYLASLEKEQQIKIDQVTRTVIHSRKLFFLKNAVDRTIFMIESLKRLIREDEAHKSLSDAEVDLITQNKAIKLIRNIRLSDSQDYIFVNKIVNYEGGDNYAVRVVNPRLPETEGLFLSTGLIDVMSAHPYAEELKGLKERGEVFYDFYYTKRNSNTTVRQMTYAKLYKPYDWVIATGFDYGKVEKYIETERRALVNLHHEQNVMIHMIFALNILTLIACVITAEYFIRRQVVRRSKRH